LRTTLEAFPTPGKFPCHPPSSSLPSSHAAFCRVMPHTAITGYRPRAAQLYVRPIAPKKPWNGIPSLNS
jgi:hypothetical protein